MSNLSDISAFDSGPPEITGFSLNVALRVLEGTGNLGQKFTTQIGLAKEFEPTGFYPYHLIVDLYQMVSNFLGWQGLFLMGSKQTPALIAARGHSEESIKLYQMKTLINQAKNADELNQSLSLFVREATRVFSIMGQREFRGKDNPYVWEVVDLSGAKTNRFCLSLKSRSLFNTESLARGQFCHSLRLFTGDSVDFKMTFLPEESVQDESITDTRWMLDFFPMIEGKTHKIIWQEELRHAEREMFRNALNYAVKQEELVALKHKELEAIHSVVVESVNYASRLQKSQLPRSERLEGRFSSFSAIWEPRDTIGGDLFWLSADQQSGSFVLAVADCTGHGVPGAMLSLLVSNSLERIYAKNTSDDPVSALMALDNYIRTGLNQDRIDSESDDGCDIAVLRIDTDQKVILFAGAKLGLFQVNTEGFLTRHTGSKCSLGYQEAIVNTVKPVLKSINYSDGDTFVIVTDGFTDQIGGPTNKISYGYRRLETTLQKNIKANAEEMAAALKRDFDEWQGSNSRRDDVTAVVFRF